MSTTIPTYRYQYRPSFSQPSGFSFSLSPPRNTFLPHHYLESPTNIFLLASNSSEDKVIVRQVGGPGDNHVQWVSRSDIIPYPDSASDEEFPSMATDLGESRVRAGDCQANSSNGNGVNDGGGNSEKRRMKTSKSYTSPIHGIVHTANWANDVGDRLWLRSDQPIIKGRRSVPVVNLDKAVSGEICISSVTWLPQKQKRVKLFGTNALSLSSITFIGAEYRQQRGGSGPFRMCITQRQNEENGEKGIISLISLKELETYFEDINSTKSTMCKSLLPDHQHKSTPTIPIRMQNETHDGIITSRSSTKEEPAVFEEGNSNRKSMDGAAADNDDDDNLSHASFASSTKGKVALDLVARSLSIFNFNAAMLDLAALSNQSMGMDCFNGNTVNEPPEASDESDEEDEDGEKEKVWSDCESQYSGRQSVMEDEDGDQYERSRVEDSGGGGDV
ncbi:hypothetical protein GE21DRAFT_241 [Neurospora crassa]|uniref:Uncharacterized protein n=1 Tax=Neurospora crassa (strain ATCC 24698 / 74-OR23-1A / CBS 708.71 / DSM 1257 / FGSC 987) TaxID=367110 RepID=V5INZ3_NEUCR|nr:hypothetical protein NCU16321 [Neurospora crassa OR74A]ESA43792.1 hypothetical protein NCU16321 [Neurospora crassa OR74A]KHE81318.1 hypothetical protein GE21DRAFT_241 [Neurospora crassa]|eukprot:XP_011393334.1 hypothetical protein NCU16321 [Neurospora crassa OR74A]